MSFSKKLVKKNKLINRLSNKTQKKGIKMEKTINKFKNQRLRVTLSIMVLSFCTVFLFLSNSANAQTQISTEAQLRALSGQDITGNYILTADITLSNSNFTPIKSLSGTFNGNYHVIKNLNITATANNVGLIGNLKGSGIIENLGLVGGTITATGKNNVGALVGVMNKSSQVTNCYAIGLTITGNKIVGGLIGEMKGKGTTSVTNVYSKNIVNGGVSSGGVVGKVGGNTMVYNAYYNNTGSGTSSTTGIQLTTGTGTNSVSDFESNPSNYLTSGVFSVDAFTQNSGYPVFSNQNISYAFINGISTETEIPSTYDGTIPNPVIIKDGGSLIDSRTTAQKTANPINNVEIQRQMKVGAWNLFGLTQSATTLVTNVLNNNVGTVSNTAHDMAAVKYDYSTNLWNTTYLGAIAGEGYTNLTIGDGYFVWPLTTNIAGTTITPNDDYVIVSQTAAPYTSDITMNKTNITTPTGQTETNKGVWFALANPYMSSLKASEICSANGITNTQGINKVYVYNPASNAWETSTYIKPGYGFMVASAENAASLIGKLTMRTTNSKSMTEETTPSNITFTCQANNTTKEAFARIDNNASNGFDNKDAYVLISTNNTDLVEPYFLVENHAVLENIYKTMPYYSPINFHASKVSNTNLTVNNIPNDVTVSIIDLSNGNETALENGSTFSFVANEGENAGRFVAKFGNKNVGIDNTVAKDNVSLAIYPNPATTQTTLIVDGLTNNAQVSICDIQGRTINNYSINKGQSTLKINTENLSSGVYYIRLISNNLTKTEKLVVK
jgi:hypothetical protein